jgi:hypothetical protein
MKIKTMVVGLGIVVILVTATTVIARNSLSNHDNININDQSIKINSDDVRLDSKNKNRHRERRNNRSSIAQRQQQETIVDINYKDLNSPHLLIISSSDSENPRLNVEIKLNGQLLKNITKSTEINISSLLKKGENIINVSGKYIPEDATINVKLSSDSTQIDQTSSGSGILDQTLIIFVK